MQDSEVVYTPIAKQHFDEAMSLLALEGWPSYVDQDRTWVALTAPGVKTLVAVTDDRVVGLAQMLTDGHIAAYLAAVVVASEARGKGIGRALVNELFAHTEAQRMDLLSTSGSEGFYLGLPHKKFPGFRIYPDEGRARAIQDQPD